MGSYSTREMAALHVCMNVSLVINEQERSVSMAVRHSEAAQHVSNYRSLRCDAVRPSFSLAVTLFDARAWARALSVSLWLPLRNRRAD